VNFDLAFIIPLYNNNCRVLVLCFALIFWSLLVLIVVSNTYCVLFLHLVYPMLPVSLDCTLLTARMETDIFTNMLILQIILYVKKGHAINSIHGIPVSNRINLALLSLDSSRIHAGNYPCYRSVLNRKVNVLLRRYHS
jgi:hypothetical protein